MTDDQIIARIRTGGQAELAWVYEEYRDQFLQWVRREFSCSLEDAKDIYQLTIVIFHDNVKSGKLQHLVSSLKSYIYGIGKNVARDHRRKLDRRAAIDPYTWLSENLSDDSDEVDENMLALARKVVAALGQPCQRLIELFYYEQKTMEEIRVELNYKNTDSAKNQKYKCMERLRSLFEKQLSTSTVNTSS